MDYPSTRGTGKAAEALVLSDTSETTSASGATVQQRESALPCRIVLSAERSDQHDGGCASPSQPCLGGTWRQRFVEQRLDGLPHGPRPGVPRSVRDEDVGGVVVKTLEEAPRDASYWSNRSMA